jgi:hypothetical protein
VLDIPVSFFGTAASAIGLSRSLIVNAAVSGAERSRIDLVAGTASRSVAFGRLSFPRCAIAGLVFVS